MAAPTTTTTTTTTMEDIFEVDQGGRRQLVWERTWQPMSRVYGHFTRPIPTRPTTKDDRRDELYRPGTWVTVNAEYGSGIRPEPEAHAQHLFFANRPPTNPTINQELPVPDNAS